MVDEVEQQRGRLSAVVLIRSSLVPVLRTHFGPYHCEILAQLDDGRARVRVAAPSPLMIAQQLAGWGAAIEVVEPSSVRAELTRIAQELLAANQPDG